MRLSTLTVVVFVAHTSTLAIAAPLPFTDELQELVARAEDDPPATSPSGAPTSASARWAQVASNVAKQVPASFVQANVRSNVVSVVQKAVGLAQQVPGNQAPRRTFPLPAPSPPPSSAVVPKTNSMLEKFKQMGPRVPYPPTNQAPSLTQQAAHLWKNAGHLTAAVDQLHKGQQSRSPGSSPSRKSSTTGEVATTRKAPTAGKSAKAPRVFKVPKQNVFASPKKSLAIQKKAKAPKLRKRDLEIDQLD